VTDPSLIARERELGFALPADYRRFVTKRGNGGSIGSYYGLQAFAATERVSKPFPCTATWIWEDEPECPERDARVAATRDGVVMLGTEGCQIDWLLVVTGEARGQIWLRTDFGVTPSGLASFDTWLERSRASPSWWHALVMDWGPSRGAFFFAHAAKQAIASSEERVLGVSAPLCQDCMQFIAKLAVHRASTYTVADPLATRHFMPDGSVRAA
jgi:hypothetical protein